MDASSRSARRHAFPVRESPFQRPGADAAWAAANGLKRVSITLALLATSACTTAGPLAPTAAATTVAADRGRAYVSRNCAECHAINTGQSPNGGAPTFAIIRLRTNELSLERRLAQLSRKGHFEMPPRSITDAEIKDVVAYIQTVEPSLPRTSPSRDGP